MFLNQQSSESFKYYVAEHETNAIQYLNPDRIQEYLSLVYSKKGCDGVKAMMHYILIVAAKHLTIMTSYHIQENNKEAVERTFAWFNNVFKKYQVIYKYVTRGRSRSKGRERSKSRSKSRGRWTEAQGTLNKKQVRFIDDNESDSSDAELDKKMVDFLQELKLCQYADNFKFNKMTYNDLLDIDNQDLIDIGVPILKHRKVILKAARQKSSRNEDTNVDLTSKKFTFLLFVFHFIGF